MYHAVVIVLALVVGGVCLYAGVHILKRFGWILDWIRGTIGLAFLAVAALVVLAALDLFSYSQIMADKELANLSFERVGDQHYRVEVSYLTEPKTENYEIYGDQWQVDARVIRWTGLIAAFGAKPGYRLDRLSGRYLSLEEERSSKRSVYQLGKSRGIDVWSFLQAHSGFPLIEATYGSATFLPMADGAAYQLSLSQTGLTAVPLNKAAQEAVKNWR